MSDIERKLFSLKFGYIWISQRFQNVTNYTKKVNIDIFNSNEIWVSFAEYYSNIYSSGYYNEHTGEDLLSLFCKEVKDVYSLLCYVGNVHFGYINWQETLHCPHLYKLFILLA